MSRQDGSTRQTSDSDDPRASILHVDLDAFFASVELLDHPELRGTPVIVGHPGGRSVVLSATYEARRLGVHAAMPMSVAMNRAPRATVLVPHHGRYGEYSHRVMRILEAVTPLVEPLGIDEAFLDVSGARKLLGTPAVIGAMIRRQVFEETGLTCSVGAASTKFIAKLASSQAKPDGLLLVPPDQVLDFLHPLPVSALWGVGAVTRQALERMALHTVRDVAELPVDVLTRIVGPAAATRLHELSWARDPRTISTSRIEKSIGHELTFDDDPADRDVVLRELLRLSARVGERLRRHGLAARTISIKVRSADFSTLTRSVTLDSATDVTRRIYAEARALFLTLPVGPVRLIGVRAEGLAGAGSVAATLQLWESDQDEAWQSAERSIDQATERFGAGSITAAALLSNGKRPPAPG